MGVEAGIPHQHVALGQRQVALHHFTYQLGKGRMGYPAQPFAGLARIAQQCIHLGGAVVARIDTDNPLAAFAAECSGALATIPHSRSPQPRQVSVRPSSLALSSTNSLTECWFRLRSRSLPPGLLQHQPLHLDVIARMSPVSLRIQIAQVKAVLQAEMNRGPMHA